MTENDKGLTGHFLAHPFADVLAEVRQNQLSGSLRASCGERKYIVYFSVGRVCFAVSNSRSARIFDMLLRRKSLTPDDLRTIPGFANDLELVSYLQANGRMSVAERQQIFVEQIEAILIDILSQMSGEWSFSHLARVRDGLSFNVDTQRLLCDYARCLPVETVLGRFRSLEGSFRLADNVEGRDKFQPAELAVLSNCSREYVPIAEIISGSRLSEAETLKALYVLWLGEMLDRLRPHPVFTQMKVSSMLDARLSLKQEAIATPRAVVQPVTVPEPVIAEASPASEVPMVALDDYLERVEQAQNYYDVLGIEHDVDAGELKKAYFTLAKTFHPDHFHKDGGDLLKRVQNAFTELTQAHETLKAPEMREAYDFKIRKELNERTKARAAGANGSFEERTVGLRQASESFDRGYSLMMDHDLASSIPFFARAVHFDPTSARYHAYYGRALASDNKQRHKAESELQAAVRLDAHNPAYRLMLAEFFIQMNLKKRAEGELNRLLAIFPSNREARQLLSSIN